MVRLWIVECIKVVVPQLSTQIGREGRFDPGCARIASRSRVEGEREKIREHEREEKYVKYNKEDIE